MKAIKHSKIDIEGISEADALILARFIYNSVGGPTAGPRGAFERLGNVLIEALGEDAIEQAGSIEFWKGYGPSIFFGDYG